MSIFKKKKPVIEFRFNPDKAEQVILYLANKFRFIDVIRLYTTILYADIKHLNKYGRPIIGDYYVATEYGLVPAQTKKMLEKGTPFVNLIAYCVKATEECNEYFLSKSDMEMLDIYFGKFVNYNIEELIDKAKEFDGWIKAIKNKLSERKVDYLDLIDRNNFELVDDLLEHSRDIIL